MIAVFMFVLIFIWKLVRLLMSEDVDKYVCNPGDTMKRTLTWLSNIV